MRPSNNKRFSTSDNCNNLTRKEHRALLYLNSSKQTVVVWLQQLKPEWCKLAQKICRACPILWGRPRTSRARILFDDSSRSARSENEAARKGYAVKSAKVKSCT